ncbi:MAG: ABC transporter substrate-binding protein, partial [Paraburkholderia tropica]
MSNDQHDDHRANGARRQLLKAAAGAATLATIRSAAGVGAAAAFALQSGAARAQVNKVLRVGFQKYGNFVVLKARGTLEKRLAPLGFSVQWLEFPGGPQLLEGLNAGAVDVGTVGETPPIFAQAGGVDFVYIASEPPAPKGEAIVVPQDSPIRTVADLRGKRVALNKGSNVHYLLVKALQKANLKYEDIQPVYLAPADARAAFTSRSVDAW